VGLLDLTTAWCLTKPHPVPGALARVLLLATKFTMATQAGEGVQAYLPDGLGWCQDNVYVCIHGCLTTPYRQQFLERLAGWANNGEWSAIVDAAWSKSRADCRVRLDYLTMGQ